MLLGFTLPFNLEKAVELPRIKYGAGSARAFKVLKIRIFHAFTREAVFTNTVSEGKYEKILRFSALGGRSRAQLLFLGLG